MVHARGVDPVLSGGDLPDFDEFRLEVGVSMVCSVGVGAVLIGGGIPEFGPKVLAALR